MDQIITKPLSHVSNSQSTMQDPGDAPLELMTLGLGLVVTCNLIMLSYTEKFFELAGIMRCLHTAPKVII